MQWTKKIFLVLRKFIVNQNTIITVLYHCMDLSNVVLQAFEWKFEI